MKRTTLSAILCMLILSSTFAGCRDAADTPAKETENGSSTVSEPAVTEETTDARVKDQVPEGTDFEQGSVRFLYRAELSDDFYMEEDSSDIVETAVYGSMRSVEERLNVNIDVTTKAGNMAADRTAYINSFTNAALAGEDVYDWVDNLTGLAPISIGKGIFSNLLDVPYIDINEPWYLESMDDMILLDHLFYVCGDVSLSYLKNAFVIYFNKQIAENYDISDLYACVDEGKWTLDKLAELARITSSDVNNDGKYDKEDQLGFLVHNYNHLAGFYGSTDIHMYEKSDDGFYKLNFGSDRDAAVCDKLYNVLYNTEGIYDCNLSDTTESQVADFNALTSKFAGGEIFMMTAQMNEAVMYLRNMKDPYGVLPYPKYDENQEKYRSFSRTTHNAFAMPISCKNTEMAGAVLEALGSERYYTVTPVYYNDAMKVKYSHDEDSARMFNIIRDSMSLCFEYAFNDYIGESVLRIFRSCYSTENAFSSTVAKNESSLQKSIEKYYTNLSSILS